jgi:hypothetical protein
MTIGMVMVAPRAPRGRDVGYTLSEADYQRPMPFMSARRLTQRTCL